MIRKLLALVCCLCLLCTGSVCAAENARLQEDILAYELKNAGQKDVQAWIDSALSESAGVGAEWYAIGLHTMGGYDLTQYRQALTAYLQENTVRSQVTRQKYALALLAAGGDKASAEKTLAETIGRQGLMSWVYGLHLMNNGITCAEYTADDAVKMILSMQLPDGGWVITGAVSDADVTAMTLQALAVHREENDDVRLAVERALVRLAEIQQPDGGYASYGKANAESTAQVWMALSTLGIDGLNDTRFMKNGNTLADALVGYRLTDGSYSHLVGGVTNTTATQQAFLASIAYEQMQKKEEGVFVIKQRGATMPARKETLGYKEIASALIGGAALMISLLLLILKKRSIKNYIAVAIAAGALIAAVWTVNIQSADEYYSVNTAAKKQIAGTVTMEIRCDTIVGKTDKEHVPADGVILNKVSIDIAEGETAYDILLEVVRANGLHMESSGTAGLKYITGIHNIYEYDFGDLSGWIYHVNGQSLSEGCDSYVLHDGDHIAWLYSCEMGNDLN